MGTRGTRAATAIAVGAGALAIVLGAQTASAMPTASAIADARAAVAHAADGSLVSAVPVRDHDDKKIKTKLVKGKAPKPETPEKPEKPEKPAKAEPAKPGKAETAKPGKAETAKPSTVEPTQPTTPVLDIADYPDLPHMVNDPDTPYYGMSLEDALVKAATEDAFRAVATSAQDKHSDTFLEAGIVQDGETGSYATSTSGYDAWITFSEPPSQEILDAIAEDQSLRVEVRYGAPAGVEELENVAAAAFIEFADAAPVMAAETVVTEDEIQVRYRLVDDASAKRGFDRSVVSGRATKKALAHAHEGGLPLPIRYVEDTSLEPSYAAAVRGGERLTEFNSDALRCTSGFSAKRGTATGTVTAAHCPNDLRWNGVPNVLSFVVEGGFVSLNGYTGRVDIQYNKTILGNNAVAEFYDGTTYRDVVAYSDGVLNGAICYYGVRGGYDCGTITNTTQKCIYYWNVDDFFCGLAAANGLDSVTGGDSGGPVFTNRTARGTFSGYNSMNQWFVPISRVDHKLSATVLTW